MNLSGSRWGCSRHIAGALLHPARPRQRRAEPAHFATDLLAVAIREVREEAGIANVYPVSEEIFSLESLTVDGHIKKGKYVSSHLHLNITYLLEADPEEHLSIKEDENSGVAWFTPEEALEKSTEPWFVERVYKKLIKKTNLLNGVRVNENEVRTE